MEQEISLDQLLEAMPKPIVEKSTPTHHKSKKKGSILDLYRCEIIHLKEVHNCSYNDILYWLKEKHNIRISKTALFNRMQHWKGLGIDG